MSTGLSARASRLFVALLASIALFYVFFCARSFRAAQLAASETAAKLRRAVRLEPLNAGYWRQLGDIELYSEREPEAALLDFQHAASLNGHDPTAWMGEAYAFQLLNRPSQERTAIGHALASAPKRLDIVWQAANLYAVLGDQEASKNELCILLEHDSRRSADVLDLLNHVLRAPSENESARDPKETGVRDYFRTVEFSCPMQEPVK
jgi:tetratricopeptide (TPR) repeat protein